jgi:hypothetical protein
MRTLLFIFLVLCLSPFCYSQKGIECTNCKKNKKEIQKKFLNEYQAKYDLLCNNKKEYFGVDLEKELNGNSPKENIFDFKFDALGCVYPEIIKNNPENFRRFFEKSRNWKGVKSNKYLYRNTFFEFKESQIYKDTFEYNVKDTSAMKILTDVDFGISPPPSSIPPSTMINFKNYWDSLFLEKEISSFNKKIKDGHFKKVVFFVHGYNVPYSVAKIQSNTFINQFKNNDKSTLFVNIYWPSTARKKIIRNKNTLFIKDKISLHSVRGFSSIVPRTFLVGNSINKILNGISSEFICDVNMYGHSLGCAVITSSILPQANKLEKNKDSELFKLIQNQSFKADTLVNFKVFLNAPAMPGLESFNKDSFNTNSKKVKWNIGFNPDDKVLNKTVFLFRFGDNNGNTRLGGNWENETWKLKDNLRRIDLEKNFNFVRTSNYKDIKGHDFFCYFNQPLFQKHLKDFIIEY